MTYVSVFSFASSISLSLISPGCVPTCSRLYFELFCMGSPGKEDSATLLETLTAWSVQSLAQSVTQPPDPLLPQLPLRPVAQLAARPVAPFSPQPLLQSLSQSPAQSLSVQSPAQSPAHSSLAQSVIQPPVLPLAQSPVLPLAPLSTACTSAISIVCTSAIYFIISPVCRSAFSLTACSVCRSAPSSLTFSSAVSPLIGSMTHPTQGTHVMKTFAGSQKVAMLETVTQSRASPEAECQPPADSRSLEAKAPVPATSPGNSTEQSQPSSPAESSSEFTHPPPSSAGSISEHFQCSEDCIPLSLP